MTRHYDVIIVGGGYAGLCCALKLKGKKVLLIESRKEIGKKHRGCQCSLYPFGESYTVNNNDIDFHINKIKAREAFMGNLAHMEVESNRHKIISTPKNPSITLDEGKTKGSIEMLCREAGVEILSNTKVTSSETDGQLARVFAGTKYEADFLVGADGARSTIMKHLPLTRKKIGEFVELEIEAEHMDLPEEWFYAHLKDVTTGMYAQTYGTGYMLGVFQGFGLNGKSFDIKAYLDESIKKLNVKGITQHYGCYNPVYLSASSSYYKNIVMTGDAVSSFSMATITGAMLMGYLAGEAVLKKMQGDADAFEEYDKRWRKELKQNSMDNMTYLFFLLKRLNEKRMGRLLKALSGADLGSVGTGYYLKRIPGIIMAFL